MNSLAGILMRRRQPMANANARGKRSEMRLSDEEESVIINELERLLETFDRHEI
jgi:hypothetical protein